MRPTHRLTRTWMLCLAALSCAPEVASDTSTQAGPSATLAQATTAAMAALYDAQLGSPACGSPGAACDSTTTLTGRGAVGPESNAPNTLGGSCPDGDDGTFHAEASVDALRVSTVDGVSYLAQGRTVKVEADVWGAPSGGSALMFFQAADAHAPQWVHLATLPTTGGAETLSTTFTLPAGGSQAVRAALVDASLAQNAPCTPGAVHDHDDLAFQVSAPDTTKPTVVASSPVSGGTYSGTVRFVAEATDNQAMGRVDFLVHTNNGLHLTSTDSQPPYELLWDSRSVPNGFVWCEMRATDAVGNSANSGAWLWVANDGAPPTVSLTSPTDWSFVRDPIHLMVNATDDIGIAQVEFYLDSTVLLGTVPGAPYTSGYNLLWNPQTAPGGVHTLAARATDTSGKVTFSAPVTVIVNRPPTVTLTSPAEGSVLSGTVLPTASVTDTTGVDHVRLQDEAGNVLCTGYNPPDYGCFWHTRSHPNGPIRVRFVARDEVGNEGSSAWVSFTLDNDFIPPTVTLTAPSEGATVSGAVVLSADASDDRGVVSKVEFLVDGYLMDTDTTAPFSVTWTSTRILNGARTVVARAWDESGQSRDSAPVNITVDNDYVLPTVSFASPVVEGATLAQTVDVVINASDDRGVISKVVFSIPGELAAQTFTSAPYVFSLNTRLFTNGPRTLTAEAYDAVGNMRRTSVNVTFDNDFTPPTVSLTSPTSGATLRDWVMLTANASDDRGGIVRVEFYLIDSAQLHQTFSDTSAPYEYLLSTRNRANGTYALQVKAWDGAGNVGTSTRVNVTFDNDFTPPTVALTSHASGATLEGTVTLTANASDERGAISQVRFYLDGTLVGVDTSAPYEYSLNTRGYSNGSRTLSASATDSSGNVGSSGTVNVTFDNDFTPPTVAITSPASGATLMGTVQLQAVASDDRGAISQVEFSLGNLLLGRDTSAPYTYDLNTRAYSNGSYAIHVRAFDVLGNSTITTITVSLNNDFALPSVSLTSPASGSVLDIGTTYTLTASASDNRQVAEVRFYLDNVLLGSDSSAPYEWRWTNNATAGSRTLQVQATDSAGNVGYGSAVSVTVRDPYAPPPSPNTFTYSASNTSSATVNTVNRTITLSAGQRLTLGTCGVTGASFSGDTYLRLANPSGTVVVSNDDACGGVGSNFVYTVPSGAGGNYQLRAGCYSSGGCSGTVAWTIQ